MPNELRLSGPYIFSSRPFPNETLLPKQDKQIQHFAEFLLLASSDLFFPGILKSSRNRLVLNLEYLLVKSALVSTEHCLLSILQGFRLRHYIHETVKNLLYGAAIPSCRYLLRIYQYCLEVFLLNGHRYNPDKQNNNIHCLEKTDEQKQCTYLLHCFLFQSLQSPD